MSRPMPSSLVAASPRPHRKLLPVTRKDISFLDDDASVATPTPTPPARRRTQQRPRRRSSRTQPAGKVLQPLEPLPTAAPSTSAVPSPLSARRDSLVRHADHLHGNTPPPPRRFSAVASLDAALAVNRAAGDKAAVPGDDQSDAESDPTVVFGHLASISAAQVFPLGLAVDLTPLEFAAEERRWTLAFIHGELHPPNGRPCPHTVRCWVCSYVSQRSHRLVVCVGCVSSRCVGLGGSLPSSSVSVVFVTPWCRYAHATVIVGGWKCVG